MQRANLLLCGLAMKDKMPRDLWHNVLMSQAAAIPLAPSPAFQFDWREIERGLPITMLEEFSAYSGIALKDLLEVVIPARTLKHRRQRREPLSLDESDRLARVARIYELAVKVYGDREGGRKWLTGTKRRFDGKTALAMLRTEVGEQAVQDFLIQIDEGYFA
jgi:putative toxin-antitoxin system antitoxin component (TIGR02293 family)